MAGKWEWRWGLAGRPALEEPCCKPWQVCAHTSSVRKSSPSPCLLTQLCFPWQAGPHAVCQALVVLPHRPGLRLTAISAGPILLSHLGAEPQPLTAPADTPSPPCQRLQPLPAAPRSWGLGEASTFTDSPLHTDSSRHSTLHIRASLNYGFLWVWSILSFRKQQCSMTSKLVMAEPW